MKCIEWNWRKELLGLGLKGWLTLWETYKKLLKMAIEIVDLPIKNGWIFHSYVSLPEGKKVGIGVTMRWQWPGRRMHGNPVEDSLVQVVEKAKDSGVGTLRVFGKFWYSSDRSCP